MRSMPVVASLCAVLVMAPLSETCGHAASAHRPGPAPPATPHDFASQEEVLRWINGYRDEPEPDRLPVAVHAMSRLGLLRDMDQAGVYVGFTAGVLSENQLAATRYLTAMFPMPPEEQGLVVKSIAYSGLPDRSAILAGLAERMPARKVLIDKVISGGEPGLFTLPLDGSPAAIDTLWGFYFATGTYQPVQRLIEALKWSGDKKDLNRLTIASMAKWTLAQNASRDKALLDLCREEVAHQPKEIADALREVITAAETFETAKIRKDALAAIEELKRKGPDKEFSWTSLGVQAAPTVIALGCVAASVTGNVEVGVPCILSGALSSAFAKLWSSSP